MHMLGLAIGFVIDNERSLSSGGRYRKYFYKPESVALVAPHHQSLSSVDIPFRVQVARGTVQSGTVKAQSALRTGPKSMGHDLCPRRSPPPWEVELLLITAHLQVGVKHNVRTTAVLQY